MKSTLLTVMLLFLMPMDSQQAGKYPLNMMEESVDDMYEGCKDKVTDEESNYLKCDMDKNPTFKGAWENVTSETKGNSILTKKQIQALRVYTSNQVYEEFNNATRIGSAQYTTNTFQFYALHWLLTSAIQDLKAKEKGKCHTTYRRNNISFVGEEGKEMRFGSFASSSRSSTKIKNFGRETCFHIETCYGAPIEDYSNYDEEEVLIPPYEKFKITKKEEGSSTAKEGLKDCKTIFELKSTGKLSNLNCKAPALRGKAKSKSFCCGCFG